MADAKQDPQGGRQKQPRLTIAVQCKEVRKSGKDFEATIVASVRKGNEPVAGEEVQFYCGTLPYDLPRPTNEVGEANIEMKGIPPTERLVLAKCGGITASTSIPFPSEPKSILGLVVEPKRVGNRIDFVIRTIQGVWGDATTQKPAPKTRIVIYDINKKTTERNEKFPKTTDSLGIAKFSVNPKEGEEHEVSVILPGFEKSYSATFFGYSGEEAARGDAADEVRSSTASAGEGKWARTRSSLRLLWGFVRDIPRARFNNKVLFGIWAATILVFFWALFTEGLGTPAPFEKLTEFGKFDSLEAAAARYYTTGSYDAPPTVGTPNYFLWKWDGILILASILWPFVAFRDEVRNAMHRAFEMWKQRPRKIGPLFAIEPIRSRETTAPTGSGTSPAGGAPAGAAPAIGGAPSGGYWDGMARRFKNFFPIEFAAEIFGEFFEHLLAGIIAHGRS